VRPDELERRLRERLDAFGPAPRAELLHVLTLPDLDRAGSERSRSGLRRRLVADDLPRNFKERSGDGYNNRRGTRISILRDLELVVQIGRREFVDEGLRASVRPTVQDDPLQLLEACSSLRRDVSYHEGPSRIVIDAPSLGP
jgi:hypothetical protein